jgi:predicted nucleotidyltransferase
MHQILLDSIPQLKQLFKLHKVKRAYAFGSSLTNNFNDSSDIDFLVRFEDGMQPEDYSDNYFNLLFSLQDLFKREIDLVSEPSIRNPYFKKSVNNSKQLIYE